MKSRKGGYKLVSLQLVELTTMTALIGLYGAIANSHDKPLLISDIVIDGERKNNLFCMVEKDGDEFIIKDVYGKDIKVTAQDEVEVTEGDYEDVTIEVTNIKALTKKQCEQLKCGDKVIKKTGNQRHLYVVTYKEHHVGMCLSYVDASVVETQSYDYINGNWVYNSEDKTPLIDLTNVQDGTLVKVLGLDSNGDIKKGEMASGGTKLYIHVIGYSTEVDAHSPDKYCKFLSTNSTPYTMDNKDSYPIDDKEIPVYHSGYISAPKTIPNRIDGIEMDTSDSSLTSIFDLLSNITFLTDRVTEL